MPNADRAGRRRRTAPRCRCRAGRRRNCAGSRGPRRSPRRARAVAAQADRLAAQRYSGSRRGPRPRRRRSRCSAGRGGPRASGRQTWAPSSRAASAATSSGVTTVIGTHRRHRRRGGDGVHQHGQHHALTVAARTPGRARLGGAEPFDGDHQPDIGLRCRRRSCAPAVFVPLTSAILPVGPKGAPAKAGVLSGRDRRKGSVMNGIG